MTSVTIYERTKKPIIVAERKGSLVGQEKPADKESNQDCVPSGRHFQTKVLESQEDIDAYVERMRSYLTAMMKDCDGIKLN